MFFNSISFAIFFFIVFSVAWMAVNALRFRTFFLTISSLFFYGMWNPWYLPLILLTTWVSWESANRLHRKTTLSRRKFWLGVSVITSLSVLVIFKYALFAKSSIETVFSVFGVHFSPEIAFLSKITLPVGISFYTFQTMSYTIDVFRGKIAPERSLLNYTFYVSFFPQLVAGPIVRASDFLPQINQRPLLSDALYARGVILIMIGLFKKVTADFIAINLVDRVFNASEMMSSLEILVGLYGYTAQIYCDFSGYSDVAIGAALLLGFNLTENFNQPFRASNLSEFWHRWHISLSTWLRDYLYIPLGGSKTRLPALTYLNLMITMLLGGLWHGSAWKFVVWGGLHGFGLALTRAMGIRDNQAKSTNMLIKIGGVVFTLQFVVAAFVFFRASSFTQALSLFARLGDLTFSHANLPWTVLTLIFGAYAVNFLP
ncbi:MBOAT family protein, partial [Myxococcota bacterium]|nr:MBOAT family protein [Myxococcota bacterium]